MREKIDLLFHKLKTGIFPDVSQNVKNEMNVEGIYNLNGQKMMKTQKGLYIMNGKKVVIK